MTPEQTFSLASDVQPVCSLSLHVRRVSESVVGRPLEVAAIEQGIRNARSSFTALTLEGEPGIGKTRLLLAGSELATAAGFLTIAVMADEEIRGPFLLARSIFASPEVVHASRGTPAEAAVQRALDAVSGRDDPGLEAMPPEKKLLRTFDLVSLAVRALTLLSPVALVIDDVQWADEDSIRLLRYLVRTETSDPIFLLAAMRPEETAQVNEAVTFVADMERMGLVRRLKVGRFSQLETAEFLKNLLGGTIHGPSVATVHAQAEGVPFVVEELAHTYRDNGMIQQIDGVWTLAPNVDRLVPSAVKTLIQRRAAHLPDETKEPLGEAAVLGRTFSLRDLGEIRQRLNEEGFMSQDLAEALEPAVTTGLLVEHPVSSPADYSFTHEQVRVFAAATLSPPRRRAVHRAICDMMVAGGEPPTASLPLIAHHALSAGDAEHAAHYSFEASKAALKSHAPEEALRLVELALPIVAAPVDRISLLCVRDEALEMLRRPTERLEGLSEVGALVEALGDPQWEMEIMLRRAAALRASQEDDRAAELARRVAARAHEQGDTKKELAALFELGQDLMRTALGESYIPNPTESDLEGAAETFTRALAIAEELHDNASIAAAERELGVIASGRARVWFISNIPDGGLIPMMARLVAGEKLEVIAQELPIWPDFQEAMTRLHRAVNLYEGLGDRRGLMSAIIAIAYMTFGPDIHLPGSAKRIEEIRRLATQIDSLTKESERGAAEAQMLYGTLVYARAKVFPDLALTRGGEAYQAARRIGDRMLEFGAAGGMAMAQVDVGEHEQAKEWLDKAAAVAAASPTPYRARQIELWRGTALAAAGDAAGMREHFERAIQLAGETGRAAARCEALAALALWAAALGHARKDEELLALAETRANEAQTVAAILPGRPPWSAQADAALARVAIARGDTEKAVEFARSALKKFEEAEHEDLHLEIFLPAAAVLLENGTEEEKEQVRGRAQFTLTVIAQRFLDQDVRVRWFRSPVATELAQIAGPLTMERAPNTPDFVDNTVEDTKLLTLLVEGRTNGEIADVIGVGEEEVSNRLAELFARMGASSRAEATAFALMGRMV
jgi:tetratricopeptide (TPR) repeat protein